MKKRIIAIATVLMMAAAPAMAQVFIDDDDINDRIGTTNSGELGFDLPWEHNMGVDVFVPVGESIFMLAGLAGAYLLGKRKNEE